MRTLDVDMIEVLGALTAHGDEVSFFLDLRSGEIRPLFQDSAFDEEGFGDELEAEPDRFEEIPRVEAREQYGWMAAFASDLPEEDSDLCEELSDALSGNRGVFGRFREVLRRHPSLQAGWNAFEREKLVAIAKDWLAGLEIEPRFQLPPLPAPAVQPPEKKRGPALDLVDLLLCGFEKNELLNGRVRRSVESRDEDAARGLFRKLAKEICGWCGAEWRKRLGDGPHFDLGRFHLRREGKRVELEVEMSASTWRAFSN